MSDIAGAVQAALVAALGGAAAIGTVVSGVFDGAPARAAFPYLVVDGTAADWSVKGRRGRELRLGITVWDDGDAAARLHGLIAAAEAAVEAMPSDLAGCRVASLIFLRTRIVRDPDGPWAGLIEYRVRVLEN